MTNIKTDLSKYFDALNGNSPHERFMSFLRFAVMLFYGGKDPKEMIPFEKNCYDEYNRVKENENYYNLFKLIGDKSVNYIDALGDYYQINISRGDNEQYFTPQHIATFMAHIGLENNLQEQENILDSACGSGRTLLGGASALKRLGKEPQEVRFFGVDIDERCILLTLFNLCINTLKGGLVKGNALTRECDFSVDIRLYDIWKGYSQTTGSAFAIAEASLLGFPRYITQWTASEDKPLWFEHLNNQNESQGKDSETTQQIPISIIADKPKVEQLNLF